MKDAARPQTYKLHDMCAVQCVCVCVLVCVSVCVCVCLCVFVCNVYDFFQCSAWLL